MKTLEVSPKYNFKKPILIKINIDKNSISSKYTTVNPACSQ